MIGALSRAFDNLLGRGDAAVTVPPLDGPLRPNRRLDEATSRISLDGVDCVAVAAGELLASAGTATHRLDKGRWVKRGDHGAQIAGIATVNQDGLAIALATGDILIEGGRFNGRRYAAADKLNCITAIAATDSELYVANGSATNSASDWQRDLLERNASGSIWRIDLEDGAISKLAERLAWPAGLIADGKTLVFSETWRHQLVGIDLANPGQRRILQADLPAYPGRIASAQDGYWLAMFAPRSQLVEFVLREKAYRKRMMSEVPQPFWVSPKLRSGRDFYESLQGGGVKHLGMLKPWAPTMSAGLCVKLDQAFQARSSLQSRADGQTHGVTAAIEYQGKLYVSARGDGVVVALPLAALGDAT